MNSAQTHAAQASRALSASMASQTEPRKISERISVSITGGFLLVAAPEEIVRRLDGKTLGVAVRHASDHLVVCITEDKRQSRKWGVTVRGGGRRNLQVQSNLVENLNSVHPKEFAAVRADSAIWGADGTLRIHLPKNLPPPNKASDKPTVEEKRQGERDARSASQPQLTPPPEEAPQPTPPPEEAPQPDPLENLPTETLQPVSEMLPPSPPPTPSGPVLQEWQIPLTAEHRAMCSVGSSGGILAGIHSEIADKWLNGWGVTIRVTMEEGRPVIFLRPDPDSGSHWGAVRKTGPERYVNIKDADIVYEGAGKRPVFTKTTPFIIAWHEDELVLKLPKLDTLSKPRGWRESGPTSRVRVEMRAAPKPASPSAAPLPEPLPSREETTAEKLRSAVRVVNELKRSLGDTLTLSVKDDGTLRATRLEEYE